MGKDITTLRKFLFPLHLLRSIEITKYFNYEPRFNDVYSRCVSLSIDVKHSCVVCTQNIFRIQDDDSIMYAFYCIAFIEHMISGEMFLD